MTLEMERTPDGLIIFRLPGGQDFAQLTYQTSEGYRPWWEAEFPFIKGMAPNQRAFNSMTAAEHYVLAVAYEYVEHGFDEGFIGRRGLGDEIDLKP